MRRRSFLTGAAGLGTALLAGCLGDDGGTTAGTGTFRLLVSDMPADIDDFSSLDVTLSSARVFRADADETITTGAMNATVSGTPASTSEDDEDETTGEDDGFVEFDLEDATVDLTQVVGDRALQVLEGDLDEGRYSGIELRVDGAEGVVDGETVDVMVPSSRLRIVRPFEIGAGEELGFVFDINVVKRGPNRGYNLLPVVGKSGVVGEDVDVEEVDTDDRDETDEPSETGTPEETSETGTNETGTTEETTTTSG